LKKLGHILARYTAWVLGLMKVLGIWGVFVIAFADSDLLGMPVDFVVATYVHQDRKRISEERFLKIHASFEQHEFWALMFPGMLPPPLPFKIFVLGAAVFEMNFWHFLGAIFAGRFVRFLVLSVLVLYFGPQIVSLFAVLFKRHWIWVVSFAAAALCVWILLRRRTGSGNAENV